MELIEVVIIVIWTFICLLGAFLNLLLMKVILMNRKISNLQTFALFALECSVSDTFFTSLCYFLMPRPIETTDSNILYQMNGFGKYVGGYSCLILYGIYNHLSCIPPVTIFMSFALRLLSLKAKQPSPKLTGFLVGLTYFPALFYLVLYVTCSSVSNTTSGSFVYIILNSSLWQYIAMSDFLVLEWIIALFGCLIMRWLILRHVNNYTATMSPSTRKIHKILVQTLTLQSIIPIVTLLAALAFGLREYFGDHPLLLSSRFLLASLVPILNAFVPLYFVTPYRKALRIRKNIARQIILRSTT